MAGNNDIHGVKILADRFGSSVNGTVICIDICKIDNRILSIGQNCYNRVNVFVTGVGLFMDIIKAEFHVAQREGYIIPVSIARVPVDDLLL